MKKTSIILLSVTLIVMVLSCSRNNFSGNNTYPRTITPAAVKDADTGSRKDADSQSLQGTIPQPRINFGNNFNVIYVKNINLDFDVEDEQVIILLRKDDKQSIKIAVLDYDSVRNKYLNTWEADKNNINYRTITLAYMDIVGDHNLEIIFSAVSSENNQLIDVLRKTHSPSGIRLYYESICSIEINGQIELQEKERSQAYHQGQKNGVSFPIVTYEEIKTDNNTAPSMLKTSYMWNYQANKYIKAIEETIPIEIVEEQKINRMLFDGIDAYKSFLEGQWYNTESEDFIIRFNKSDNEIAFFTSDILEIYRWSDFNYSRLNKMIDITARNDLIHFISKRIYIKIENMNRIRVDIKDRENPKDLDQMNGYYERISDDIIASIYSVKEDQREILSLKGEYYGSDNTLNFNDNRFTLKSKTSLKKGIYSVYNYNSDTILELRYIDDNQLVTETNLFSIGKDIREMETTIINRIILTKGIITANMFKPSGEDPLLYTQTLEKEKKQ